ncbi:MAG: hypothetical protein V1792_23400 [Pseudomonadota bacterium]
MPTGYTAAIGEGISFENFVLRCARNFGALIEMRDDSLDKPIPNEFKPSDYYDKALAKAVKMGTKVETMSDAEAEIEAEKEYKKAVAERAKSDKENAALLRKYEEMLKKVRDWQPPTSEHMGLRSFMIQQIEESIRFDCDYEHEAIKRRTGEEWLRQAKAGVGHDIKYYTEERDKEITRCKERSVWVRELKKSLGLLQ